MNIQYFSDIHLEFGELTMPPSEADLIVAAGDIGVGTQAIEWLQRFDVPVIYIAGNHEYYGQDFAVVNARIRHAVAGTNIHFLECDSVELDGVRFLGTTLWTDYGGGNREVMDVMATQMNDYHQITFGQRNLLPTDLLEVNAQSRDWLTRSLAQPFTGKTVVVTHHAPLYTSWQADNPKEYQSAYCNDLSQLLGAHDIALWIHGHVHHRYDYTSMNTRVVCNPRGYDGYQLADGFEPLQLIELNH